jgi:hypothetical protein
MNVKTVLLNRVIEEEAYVEQPQGFEVYQKRPLYADRRIPYMDSSKLGAEHLMYNKSVVKTSYDRGCILKWFFRSLG